MQHFYDGQLRRYITQIVRLLSNFVVKYGDGTLVRVPVMYGDQDRQAATIVNQNSESTVASAPRIAVYINDLDLSRERLGDSTYVGKLNIREREFDRETGEYTASQGTNYTVERLMPTPFDLTFKVDIWSSNTDQKLQILEQILTLFNPSLEIQTTDNYIDWTSLSVVELQDVTFSSRSVPVGTNSAIDIATLSLKTPVWLSPPAKIKKLGIITSIIANIYNNASGPIADYIDGLGVDLATGSRSPENYLTNHITTIGNFDIFVEENTVKITSNEVSPGTWLSWESAIAQYPGKYTAGLSKIFLTQSDGTAVVGNLTLSPLDATIMTAVWDTDTFSSNSAIAGPVRLESDWGFFDAIIDPTTFNPKRPNKEKTDQSIVNGTRYLIVEDIGDIENTDGADGWKGTDNSDLVAQANDIIEWNGTKWVVVFAAAEVDDTIVHQMNFYTRTQYKWNGVEWNKSFEGEYKKGRWRISL
jgi:hypothetical protein